MRRHNNHGPPSLSPCVEQRGGVELWVWKPLFDSVVGWMRRSESVCRRSRRAAALGSLADRLASGKDRNPARIRGEKLGCEVRPDECRRSELGCLRALAFCMGVQYEIRRGSFFYYQRANQALIRRFIWIVKRKMPSFRCLKQTPTFPSKVELLLKTIQKF